MRIKTDPKFREGEFAEARSSYQEDVRERVKFGSSRIKKRQRSVKRNEITSVKNKMAGTMMEETAYVQESRSKNLPLHLE